MVKPENPACLRNQDPIYQALRPWLKPQGHLLELACGTGQHGVYLASRLPHIHWHFSEHPSQLQLSQQWISEAKLTNLHKPIPLDVSDEKWANRLTHFDYGYCANLLHFVSEQSVKNVFNGFSQVLNAEGLLFCYGPINEHGFTSEGNQALDNWLKQDINPLAGIKELDWIKQVATNSGLIFLERLNLPANNVVLIFKKL